MHLLPFEQVDFSSLLQHLRQGGTLVYPTETCYGLGCDPNNAKAVAKVFAIKQRPENKPLLLVFPTVEMVKKYIVWTPLLESLAREYWPGALTIVTEAGPQAPLAPALTQIENTIAVRVSQHPFVQHITTLFQAPLVSTSANIAGEPNPYTATQVAARFSTEILSPDIIIDAGTLPFTPPSTIVKVQGETLTILRQGEVQVIHPT